MVNRQLVLDSIFLLAVLDISIISIYNFFFLKEMRTCASKIRDQSSVMHLEKLSKEITVFEL